MIHGHGTSLRLLEEEHVGDADFFVACTRDDEENIMACLQVRKLGARKLYLAINRADYSEVIQTSRATLGIDVAVSPRLATATEVLRYISKEKYIELATLPGGVGRVIELKIVAGSACDGHSVREIKWPVGSVVLALQHKGDARTPGPDDVLHAGDRIVCLLQPELLNDIVRLATRA
jgi:trk system potassium uptake protein TrkA